MNAKEAAKISARVRMKSFRWQIRGINSLIETLAEQGENMAAVEVPEDLSYSIRKHFRELGYGISLSLCNSSSAKDTVILTW